MRPSLAFGAALGALVGCSNPPPVNTDVTPADAVADAAASGLPGDRYCSTVTNPPCQGTARATCGVCVTPPESATDFRLSRTACANLTGTREFCDTMNPPGAPNLGCFASPPPAPTPRTVTIWGVVDVFGTGGDSNHIRVEVMRVGPDGAPMMPPLGTAVTDTALPYHEEEDELNSRGEVTQHRLLGAFQIPGIPTDTALVIRTVGDPADRVASMDLWSHPIYDYTLAIRGSDVMVPPATTGIAGDAVRVRPRAISNADWSVIPTTATLTSGIPAGQGALAGEVHDCDDIRLNNAMVYASPAPNFESTVYFSDNDTRPLPDTSRQSRGTQLLGLYSMLALNPGPTRVAAVGYDATGALVHAGFYQAQIFPNAVTVVTLRGRRPWQTSP